MHLDENKRKPLDLNEWAYMTIKMQILNNKIKPKDQLNIEELTKTLNISRTPIREALLRLKQEGLVIAAPRVGFFVSGITQRDYNDLFILRQLIECYAAQESAEKMSDKDLEKLERIQKRSKVLVKKKKIKEFNQLEIQFHSMLIESLNNKRIQSVIDSIADLIYRERFYALNSDENVEMSLIEHGDIFSAILAHDAKRAYEAMKTHILNVKSRVEKLVEFQEE